MKREVFVAAAALFNPSKEVLIARRAPGQGGAGHWEFPGGKIEAGETAHAALVREIKEELSISIHTAHSLGVKYHIYDALAVHLELFAVPWPGQPIILTEHTEMSWVPFQDLHQHVLAAADVPFIPLVQKYLESI